MTPQLLKPWRPNITIVAFSANGSFREVRYGLLQTLRDKVVGGYTYDFVNGENDYAELKERFSLRFRHSPTDFICTLGRSSTLIAKEVTLETGILTPIVYGGVLDPEGCGLGPLNGRENQHITGIGGDVRSYTTQAKKLLELQPLTKKVILLRSTCQEKKSEQSICEAAEYLESNNIEVKNIIVSDSSDIFSLVNPVLDGVDVLMMARDMVVTSRIDELVDLCNIRGITLFASDEVAVRHGASLGYYDPERGLGIQIGNHMLPLIRKEKCPSQIPLSMFSWEGNIYLNRFSLNWLNTSISSKHNRLKTVSL